MITISNKTFILIMAMVCLASSQLLAVERSVDEMAKRLTTRSPWFSVNEGDVELQASYSGFDSATNERFSKLSIGDKALAMIDDAEKVILGSAFLFDCFYGETPPQRDIVSELTAALVQKKKQHPSMTISIVLDPVNKAYGRRVSPAVKTLTANGIDVFYSDLTSTKSATRLGVIETAQEGLRLADKLVFGSLMPVLSFVTGQRVPIKNPLDEKGISIQTTFNALALKANHRKLLVTDAEQTYEALISSANPHNASIPSTNFAVSVKGEPAKYIYMTIREDVIVSSRIGDAIYGSKSKRYKKDYFSSTLPAMPTRKSASTNTGPGRAVEVCFVTESRIREEIIEMLSSAKPDDHIRIQMFYLSEPDVVDAIAKTAERMRTPIRLILDPNKDAFGKQKDGTPNRQVAAYLMKKKKEMNLKLDIRWYETYGEQNHAKIMTITNPVNGKNELLTGSANWTGKNLNDINLEANVRVKGSKRITAQFNGLFDLFWYNSDGKLYTITYRGKYEKHTGMNKWLDGENGAMCHGNITGIDKRFRFWYNTP